jgi:hypothetical protein
MALSAEMDAEARASLGPDPGPHAGVGERHGRPAQGGPCLTPLEAGPSAHFLGYKGYRHAWLATPPE